MAYIIWHSIAYMSHTFERNGLERPILGHMGVSNTFPMCNRSSYHFFGPQWPCVVSIRDGFTSLHCLFTHFLHPVFLVFRLSNKLGGDSISFYLFPSFSPFGVFFELNLPRMHRLAVINHFFEALGQPRCLVTTAQHTVVWFAVVMVLLRPDSGYQALV